MGHLNKLASLFLKPVLFYPFVVGPKSGPLQDLQSQISLITQRIVLTT